MTMAQDTLLPDLLTLTGAAVAPAESLLAKAIERVRTDVSSEGRVSAQLLEENQTAAHGLAWLATYVESLRQMQKWAEGLKANGQFGTMEQLIHQIAFGEYLWQIYGGIQMNQGEVVRLQDIGLSQDDARALMNTEVSLLCEKGNTQAARLALVALMQEGKAEITFGKTGLED